LNDFDHDLGDDGHDLTGIYRFYIHVNDSFYEEDFDCLGPDRGWDSHFLTDSHYFKPKTTVQFAFSLSMIFIAVWALKGILVLGSLLRMG
jgi:hypothetical protein